MRKDFLLLPSKIDSHLVVNDISPCHQRVRFFSGNHFNHQSCGKEAPTCGFHCKSELCTSHFCFLTLSHLILTSAELQVFATLWFWLVFVAAASCLGLILWLFTAAGAVNRTFVRKYLTIMGRLQKGEPDYTRKKASEFLFIIILLVVNLPILNSAGIRFFNYFSDSLYERNPKFKTLFKSLTKAAKLDCVHRIYFHHLEGTQKFGMWLSK